MMLIGRSSKRENLRSATNLSTGFYEPCCLWSSIERSSSEAADFITDLRSSGLDRSRRRDMARDIDVRSSEATLQGHSEPNVCEDRRNGELTGGIR